MASIACDFKKFAEATAQWYDAGERVVCNGCVQTSVANKKSWCSPQKVGSEHNFVLARFRTGEIVVLNCDLTPISDLPFSRSLAQCCFHFRAELNHAHGVVAAPVVAGDDVEILCAGDVLLGVGGRQGGVAILQFDER